MKERGVLRRLTCSYDPVLTAEFNTSWGFFTYLDIYVQIVHGLTCIPSTHLKINKSKATAVFAGKATSFYPSLSVTKLPG